MTALSVNLNKIALIRNSRNDNYPSVGAHAKTAIAAGADGITAHPRPDQRHIRADDCRRLAKLVAEAGPSARGRPVEFNMEGNPFAPPSPGESPDDSPGGRDGTGDYPGFMALAREVRPHQCTLVPDSEDQLTSDHGFDLKTDGDRVAPLLAELAGLGIRTSLFMEPEPEQIRLAAALGADRIELYTGSYAHACKAGVDIDAVFDRFRRAAETALEAGLGLNAGHDLNLDNLPRLAGLPGLLEVSIGHALTVDALDMGFSAAVAAYRRILDGFPGGIPGGSSP